jgi:hypothetical protein
MHRWEREAERHRGERSGMGGRKERSGAKIDQTMPSNYQSVPPIIGLELGVAGVRSSEALCRREEPSEEMHVHG